jgi:hypothetical protein
MTKHEFQRKMKAVYPEKKLMGFKHTEVQNAAYFDGYLFWNNVHSDAVHIQTATAKYCGRAETVERA